ncbi:MAG: zinc-binding dehydrogenase, partial [Candidatus Poribacteria bacterium]
MSRTGRAVIAHGQDFDIREYAVPDPNPDTLLVRQELGGICGTDLHMWQNGIPGEMLLGHENVGIIDKLGADVTTDYVGNPVREGDRIIFAPGTASGAYGFQSDPDTGPHFRGGFADYIHLCLPNTLFIKTDLEPEVAVMTEPFTIGVHAVMRGGIEIGDTVVVQGSGAIGLVTLVCAKISGAAKIIMVGGPAGRLDLAKRMGADVTVNIEDVASVEERTEIVRSHTPRSAGANVVFECAGFLSAIPEGLGYTKYGGTFVEVGAGAQHSCGLKTDATIVCWGDNGSGQTAPPAGLVPLGPLPSIGDHSCDGVDDDCDGETDEDCPQIDPGCGAVDFQDNAAEMVVANMPTSYEAVTYELW